MSAEPDTSRRRRRRVTGPWLAIVVAAGFVGLLVYGVTTRSPDTTIDDSLAKARAIEAPGFEASILERGTPGRPLEDRLAPALADGQIALRELRGTPIVLNFWASWCVPCREEGPGLQRAWQAARGRGILFLGLDEQDTRDDARRFLRDFRIDYLNVREPTNSIGRRYGVTGFPETFFISGAGDIVGHVIGVADEAKLTAGIAAARAGRVIGAEHGGDRSDAR